MNNRSVMSPGNGTFTDRKLTLLAPVASLPMGESPVFCRHKILWGKIEKDEGHSFHNPKNCTKKSRVRFYVRI